MELSRITPRDVDMSGQLDPPDLTSAEDECRDACQRAQELIDGITEAMDAMDALNLKRGEYNLPRITDIEEAASWLQL